MKKLLVMLTFLSTCHPVYAAERETYYSTLICAELYHGTEPYLSGPRLFPDCATEFVVMEFDWAYRPKHYECIGQALIYAQETGKIPVCVLLARNDEELAFGYEQNYNSFGVLTRVIDTRLWDPK